MANISKNALRSRIAINVAAAEGARGFQKNPQDFSSLVGTKHASRQEFLKAHWEFLPEYRLARAEKLSTTFRGVPIEKDGQFGLSFG